MTTPAADRHAGMTRRSRIAIIAAAMIAATLLALAAIAAVLVTTQMNQIQRFLAGAQTPESSASLYPAGTLAYAWTTLLPQDGQQEYLQGIQEQLGLTPGFEEMMQKLEDDVEESLGFRPREELAAWAGPDLSLGITGYDPQRGRPEWAATASVRDREAAEEFAERVRQHLEEEDPQAPLERDEQDGFTTWANHQEGISIALSEDLMIVSNDWNTIQHMIDAAGDSQDDNLADTPAFQEARAAMADRRASSIYVSIENAAREMAAGEGSALHLELWTHIQDRGPDWMAATMSWEDDAIRVETVPRPDQEPSEIRTEPLEEPARLLPADTLAFLSFSFDPHVDHWRERLAGTVVSDLMTDDHLQELNRMARLLDPQGTREINPGDDASALLDLAMALVQTATGVDLEEGLMDHLDGELTIARWGGTLSPSLEEQLDNHASIVIILDHREGSGEQLAGTMSRVEEIILEYTGTGFSSHGAGSQRQARVADTGGETSPGYVLTGRELVLGSSLETLEGTVSRSQDGEPGLDQEAEYRRARDLLPRDLMALAYLDAGQALERWDDGDGAEQDPARTLEASAGVLAAACTRTGRCAAVLTLFPR